ncbi:MULTISPECIES: trypsin-like peptidase domain-containing protein [unclassified Mesorhizobium]|uniref:trypsin-like peptidase domain-containing protein n=1 Tax=unclassified Mesorhizobium TaxID=325217 RepID=UPI00333ACCC8
MQLTGPQIGEVRDAIVATFTENDLGEFILIKFDLKLDVIIAQGNLNNRALHLVEYFNNRGIVTDLVREAYAERSRVEVWQCLDKLYGARPPTTLQASLRTTTAGPAGAALEAVVKPRLKILNMELWRVGEAQAQARVCRVDIGPTPKGTGFLVGPDLVLTNYHVLTSVIAEPGAATSVKCVFDYKRLADGTVQQGRAVALAAGDGWLVDKSPPTQAELDDTPEATMPGLNELDFALLRLAEPIGAQPVATPTAGPRGFVPMPGLQPPLPAHGALIIVQHPDSEPVSFALDTDAIIAVNANGTRVRYATNTEHGSSGSPCFDMDWTLLALHHLGDPNWRSPGYNQGVPIGLIANRVTPHLTAG